MQPDNKNSNNEEETGSDGSKRATPGFVFNVQPPEDVLRVLKELPLPLNKVEPEELGLLFMLRAFQALSIDVEVIHSTSTETNEVGLQVSDTYLLKITPANEKDNPLTVTVAKETFKRTCEEAVKAYGVVRNKRLVGLHPKYQQQDDAELLVRTKQAIGEAAKQLVRGVLNLLYGRLKIRNYSGLGCGVLITDLRSVVISVIETAKDLAGRRSTELGVLARVPTSGEVAATVVGLTSGAGKVSDSFTFVGSSVNEQVIYSIWRTAVIGLAIRIEEHYAKYVKEPSEEAIVDWFEQFVGLASIQSPKCKEIRGYLKDLHKDNPENVPSSLVLVYETLYASLLMDTGRVWKVAVDGLADRPELVNYSYAVLKERRYNDNLTTMLDRLRKRFPDMNEDELIKSAKEAVGSSPMADAACLNTLAVVPSIIGVITNGKPCIVGADMSSKGPTPQNFEELIKSLSKVETPEERYNRIKDKEELMYKGLALRFRRREDLADYNNGIEGNARQVDPQEGGKHLLNTEKAFVRGAYVSRYFNYSEGDLHDFVSVQGEAPTYYRYEDENKITGYGLREGMFCSLYYGNRLLSWLEHAEELLVLRCKTYGIPAFNEFKERYQNRLVYHVNGTGIK